MEEGAILLDKWTNNNFCDFEFWLQNADAQATFNIDEKVSFNSKPNKAKTIQIKNYQCHLELQFSDTNIDSLIANGFGKSKREARKTSIKQMVTFLIQKRIIKYGLKDKSFLYKKQVKPQVNFESEKKHLVPEEEKKLKEIKSILKRMTDYLKEENFEEAIIMLKHILEKKESNWQEISPIWSFAIENKNINQIKSILHLITHDQIKTEFANEDLEIDYIQTSDRKRYSQNILKTKYGYYRTDIQNPYEIFDHYSLDYNTLKTDSTEMENNFASNVDTSNSLHIDNGRLKFNHQTHDEFKNILLTTGQNDPQTKFFLKNQHLSGTYIPQIVGDHIMSDFDNINYVPNLENEGSLREAKRSDLRYVSYKLVNEMYSMLMYSGDLCFSLHAIELVYQILKMDDAEFVNWCAAHYFFNRYNILCCELIESTYKGYRSGKSFNTICGSIIKCGSHLKKDVLMFSPDMTQVLKQPMGKLIYRKNCYDEISSSMVQENEYILLVEFESDFSKTVEKMEEEDVTQDNLPEKDFKLASIKNDSALLEKMSITDKKVKSVRLVFVNEISKDFKLKIFTMNREEENYFSSDRNWAIIKPEYISNKLITKQMETCIEFCTKVTMNPAVQQMILSTPSCQSDYLMKIAKSSSIIMNNPSTKNRLQTIIEQLVEKLNPGQLKSVRTALTSNMTFIQTPSGTNKILTTVEIVRAWLKYSQFQVLVFSENRIDCDMIHMGLLKSGIRSLCLNDELPLEEGYKDGLERIMDILCNNHFYLNPYYAKSEEMKSILNEFRVVCCTKEDLINESLKNVTFSRVLVDDANQMKESTL